MNRLTELDSLRGIAAVFVVLFHYTFQYFNLFGYSEPITTWFKYGGLGVQLFFVISGIVILISLNRSRGLMDFYISRFSRLYPPYWFAVIFSSIIIIFGDHVTKDISFKEFLLNLTMIQYFFGVDDIDGVYWTLRVELTFYFWVSILFFLLPQKVFKISLVAWILTSLLIPYLDRVFNLYSSYPTLKILDRIFMLQFTAFFLSGVSFYYMLINKKSFYPILLAVLCLIVVMINYDFKYYVSLMVIDLVFVFTLKGYFKFLKHKFLIFLGGISYSLYLIHQVLGYYLIESFKGYFGLELSILFTICIVIGLSWLIKEVIEDRCRIIFKNYLSDLLFQLKGIRKTL